MNVVPTSTNTRLLPLPKRILAILLAAVLVIGLMPAMPQNAFAADSTIATSAGSKSVTRTVEFVYEGDTEPFTSVKESFTFQWGKGVDLRAFTHTFDATPAADYWSEYPEDSWTFDPETVPADTVNAYDGQDFVRTVTVKVKQPSASEKGTTTVKFVNKNTDAEITSLTVTDVTKGTPFTQSFSSGPYAGKNLVQAVDDVVSQLSGTYYLASQEDNPITNAGSYEAGTKTYYVRLTPKDTSNIDTSVTVQFLDQYDNDIVLDGYYAQIESSSNASLNGTKFSAVKYGDGLTLPQKVANKIAALEAIGYTKVSTNFPDNGTFGPTAQTYTVRMHKPSIEDGQVTPPADVVYNGSSQKPKPTVVVNGKMLEQGTDYIAIYPGEKWTLGSEEVSQDGNTIDAGVKEVKIVGWGDYAGYRTTTSYQILPLTITASISQTEFTYNGNVQRPNVTVSDVNGNSVPRSAYAITWQDANSKEVGSYTVGVKATNSNYEGEASFVYVINKAAEPEKTSIGTSNSSITVEGPAAATYNGSKQQPGTFVVKDGSKTLVEGVDYTVGTWSNTSFTNAGNYTVAITGKGTYKDSRTITYTINKAKITSVELSANSLQAGSAAPTYVVKDANGRTLTANTDYTPSWNPSLDMNKAGSYTLTATPKGSNFTTDKASATLTVSAKALDEIGSPSVTADIADVTYNGTSQKVKPAVKSGTTPLKEGTDYTLSYSGDTTNVTAAGVTVTITGKGNFTGSRTVTYRILPAEISSVTASDQTYDGTAKTPALTVKAGSLTVPTSGYTATYSNNTNVGTANVQVDGKGNYTGKATTTFNIVQASVITTVTVNFVDNNNNPITSVSPNPYSWQGLSGSAINQTASASVDNLVAFLKNSYTVDESEWTAFKKGTHPSTAKTITIKGTPLPTHNVLVKIFTGSKGNLRYTVGPITGNKNAKYSDYTMQNNGQKLPEYVEYLIAEYAKEGFTEVQDDGWRAASSGTLPDADKTFEIVLTRPNSDVSTFTVASNPASSTYNGARQVPTIVVKSGSDTLVAGRDYTISWAPNNTLVNAGTYTATITGVATNGYSGTKQVTYTINKVAIDKVELSANSAKVGAAQPTFVVRDANGNEVSASNYDVIWSPVLDMSKKGTYTLTVKAKDGSVNYMGTATATFDVTEDPKTNISSTGITVSQPGDVVYDGASHRQTVTVKNGSTPLVEDTDYTLSYSNDVVNAGTVTVTITGKGAYVGSRTVTYTIKPAEITAVTAADQNYTGQAKTPTPSVMAGNKVVPASGYSVTYDNNTNAGTATVTVTGKGNYTGTKTGTFTIAPARLWTMDTIADVNYNGSAQRPTVVVKNSAGTVLKEGTDYTVSYGNNTNVGTAKATATGKGNYTGEVSRNFRIVNPETGGTTSTVTVNFKNSDGTDFTNITPNPLQLNGPANQAPNAVTIEKLNEILDNQAANYDIDRADWDAFVSKNVMPNKNEEITITFSKKGSGGSGTPGTPTVRSTVSVTVKATDEKGTTTSQSFSSTEASGTKLSTTTLDSRVQAKVKEFTDAGYKVDSDTWTAAKGGTFGAENASYSITLSKPASGSSTTPAQESYVLVKVVDEYGNELGSTNIWHGNTNMSIAATGDDGATSLKSQTEARIKEQTDKGYTYTASDNTEWENIKKSGKYPAGGTSWSNYKTVTVKLASSKTSISTNNKSITAANPAAKTYSATGQPPAVTVKNGNTILKEGTDYTISWKPDANFTNAGTYTGTITGKGNYKDTRTITYTINKANTKDVTVAKIADQVYDGKAKTPTVKATFNGVDVTSQLTVTYTKNINAYTWTGNPSSVGGTPVTKAISLARLAAAATSTTASGTDGPRAVLNPANTSNFTGTAVKPFNITPIKVTPPTASDKTYNGKAQRGVPEAPKNANYSLGGTGSASKAGTYTTTAHLPNTTNYVWTDGTTADKKLTWKINPAKLKSVTAADQTYDGKAKTPALTVKAEGYSENVITQAGAANSAYEIVKWENNINAGTAKVTVKGKENFTGTVTGTFKINKATVAKPTATSRNFNAKEQTGVAARTGYTVTGGSATKAGSYTATAKLNANYTWSDGSTADVKLPWKINAKPINATTVIAALNPTSYTYDGKAKTPAVTVKDTETGKTLVKDTDYTVEYKNNTNTGTATAVITGKGNYTNSRNATFTITGSQKTVKVTVKQVGGSSQAYNSTGDVSMKLSATDTSGSSIVKRVQAKVDEGKKAGYTQIDWGGWDKAKDGTFYAAKAEYTVTLTKPASAKTDLAKATVTFSPTTFTYNGKQQRPTVTVKVGNTTVPASDYDIKWPADTTNVGSKPVTVTAKSTSANYTGTSKAANYTITGSNNNSGGSGTSKGTHKVVVKLVDSAGKAIADGGSNQFTFTGTEGIKLSSDFTKQVNNRIDDLKKKGWSVQSNPFKGTSETIGSADRTITIKLKASTTTITQATYKSTYKPGTKLNTAGTQKVPSNLALSKDVTRTITYKMPDSTKAPANKVQKVTFTRTATIDNTNGKITYGAWSPAKGTWDAVTPPTVKGYSAKKVDANKNVTADTKNTTVTVNYTKNVVNKKVSVTVRFTADDGTTGSKTLSMTAPTTTKLTSKVSGGESLATKVQKQVNEYKSKGYSKIDWDGWDVAKGGTYDEAAASYTITMAQVWHRLWGKNQFDTMAKIGQAGWANNSGGTVIIATAANFPDALSASGVAGLYGAQVLLTNRDSLPSQTRAELTRTKPSRIIVAGGPGAIRDTVLNTLRSVTGVTPQRVYGRYASDTAAELNKKYFGKRSSVAILATSKYFYDSLSAAPISYAKHYPIFLAENASTISANTISAMKACGIKQVIIVGGTSVIGSNVVSTLSKNKISVKTRLGGRTYFDTSRLIAEWGLNNGMNADKMGVATAKNFYDALTGAAFCGKNNAVLVLADERNMSNSVVAKNNQTKIFDGYVFGGVYAVSAATYDAFDKTSRY